MIPCANMLLLRLRSLAQLACFSLKVEELAPFLDHVKLSKRLAVGYILLSKWMYVSTTR